MYLCYLGFLLSNLSFALQLISFPNILFAQIYLFVPLIYLCLVSSSIYDCLLPDLTLKAFLISHVLGIDLHKHAAILETSTYAKESQGLLERLLLVF
jgi:hypothetical protein